MSDSIVPKLKALPVLEVTPEEVKQIEVADIVTFLVNGGAIYYMVTQTELIKARTETFSMTERLFNVLRGYVKHKYARLAPEQEKQVLDAVRVNLYNPLKVMEQNHGQFVQVAVEVKITTDDDDIRIHYTLRDKNGKSLRMT